jgi:ABC-type nitrate/sulfonate/bicarbonate transport system permease component
MNRQGKINVTIFIFLSVVVLNIGLLVEILFPSVSHYLAPNLLDILGELFINYRVWGMAIIWTCGLSIIGVIMSCIIGCILGFLFSYFRLPALDMWMKLFWSIPLVAISTYFVLVIGLNWLYGLALSIYLGFYPIEKHVFDYCSARSDGINSLSAAFGLTKWQEYLFLRLSGSIRSMGTALAQSIPLCFIGETMAEFTTGKISNYSIGLGGYVRFASNYSNYTQLWLSIILMMLLVFLFNLLVEWLWNICFPNNKEGDALQ